MVFLHQVIHHDAYSPGYKFYKTNFLHALPSQIRRGLSNIEHILTGAIYKHPIKVLRIYHSHKLLASKQNKFKAL